MRRPDYDASGDQGHPTDEAQDGPAAKVGAVGTRDIDSRVVKRDRHLGRPVPAVPRTFSRMALCGPAEHAGAARTGGDHDAMAGVPPRLLIGTSPECWMGNPVPGGPAEHKLGAPAPTSEGKYEAG